MDTLLNKSNTLWKQDWIIRRSLKFPSPYPTVSAIVYQQYSRFWRALPSWANALRPSSTSPTKVHGRHYEVSVARDMRGLIQVPVVYVRLEIHPGRIFQYLSTLKSLYSQHLTTDTIRMSPLFYPDTSVTFGASCVADRFKSLKASIVGSISFFLVPGHCTILLS